MTVVSITEPRFIREVIDRRRLVIVAYGRMESTVPQGLYVLFQGEVLYYQVGHNGRIDVHELVKNMHRIDTEQRRKNMLHVLPSVSDEEAKCFVEQILASEIVQYFSNPPSKRTKALNVESDQLLHWNSKAFRFDEVDLPTLGKRLLWQFPTSYVHPGDIPPEMRQTKGRGVNKQTEAATVEQIYQQLAFWLFGPITDKKL
ncbi:hypothetical protein ACMG5L_24490 [Escherichia coli]|uniref:hypothetical protein n=1 Tax=Escherichia coli TaxID=562 RepID=UPI0039BF505C